MRFLSILLFACALGLSGCLGGPQPEPPTLQPDAGAADAAVSRDTGRPATDAGPAADASTADSGTPTDAGTDGEAMDGDITDGDVTDGALDATPDGDVTDGALDALRPDA